MTILTPVPCATFAPDGSGRTGGAMCAGDMPGLVITDRAAREEVQHLAYALWLKDGSPEGRHLDHWLEAESEVVSHRKRELAPAPRGPTNAS